MAMEARGVSAAAAQDRRAEDTAPHHAAVFAPRHGEPLQRRGRPTRIGRRRLADAASRRHRPGSWPRPVFQGHRPPEAPRL